MIAGRIGLFSLLMLEALFCRAFYAAVYIAVLGITGPALNAGAAPRAQVARYAIVIGHNQADEQGRKDLKYADDDAIRAHLLFQQAGVNSLLLVSKDPETQRAFPKVQAFGPPTKAHVLLAFEQVQKDMGQEKAAELILFFSGHGNVEHGQGYLVLQGGKLTRNEFALLLAESPSVQRHIFIDACKSYYMAFEKGPGGQRSPYSKSFVDFGESGDRQRNGFILSTSADRQSHEWERYQSGVFSHELMSGLRGGADADGDGRISYAEIGAFLETANKGIENLRLRPLYFVRPPGRFPGDLTQTLLAWPEEAATFHLDVENLGHVYVEDALGQRILDLHPASPHKFSLHLPNSRPLFLRQVEGEKEWVIDDKQALALSGLESRSKASMAAKGALERALDMLFVLPFGPADQQRYSGDFLRVGQWTLSLMQAREAQASQAALRIESRPRTETGTLGVAKWSGAGLTLATGAAAAFLGVLADKDAEAAREEIYGSADWQDKADLSDRESLSANSLAGVAGALAVGTLVLFIIDGLDGPGSTSTPIRTSSGQSALGLRF